MQNQNLHESNIDVWLNHHDLNPAIRLKQEIKAYLQNLEKIFSSTQGKAFLLHHTRAIDDYIEAIYRIVNRQVFGNYQPMFNQIPIVLCAMGSYGREQLSIYSDIDLMIVYKETPGFNTQMIIEKILYLAWDCGMKLGHRVHEIDDLLEASREDITIKSALLESRMICGSRHLFVEVDNRLMQIRKDDPKQFVIQKIEEMRQRLQKHAPSMTPEIKEGYGGIRDANTLFWLVGARYGVKNIKEAQQQLGFDDREYREFRLAMEYLFRIRGALHLCAGKKQDRVVLEQLPCVAARLGFDSGKPLQDQMQCASKMLQSMHIVHRFATSYIDRVAAVERFNPARIAQLRRCRIARGLYYQEGRLLGGFMAPKIKLSKLMEMLSGLPDEPFAYDARTVRFCMGVMVPSSVSQRSYRYLSEIFARKHAADLLGLLMESELLSVLLPAFKKIRFLPQFDGYHTLPVDAHTICAVRNFEQLDDPFLSKLKQKLTVREQFVLKLVIFFHDIGKGRVRDHSLVGESLFRRNANRFDLNVDEVRLGCHLIRHHTFMSGTVRREDIYNENTLFRFVSKIKTPEALDRLYLLTYCDVQAVGKGILSGFVKRLLQELYRSASGCFQKKELISEATRRLRKEEQLKKIEPFLALSPALQKKALSISSSLFFLKYSPEKICEIARWAADVEQYQYGFSNDDLLVIEIVRKIPINLGYLLGRLSYLDIASMDIYRLFDGAKYFRIEFHGRAGEEDMDDLSMLIEQSFQIVEPIKLRQVDILKKEISINPDHSLGLAEVRLNAKDQKGLLAHVSKVFDDLGIEIVTAKINTYKKRVRDMFLIEKNENFWNNKDQIKSAILGEVQTCVE